MSLLHRLVKSKPNHTTRINRRNILIGSSVLYSSLIPKSKANEEMPTKDIFILEQVVKVDNMIADYIDKMNIDLTISTDKYIENLLEAYDDLVGQIDDDEIKPILREHLSRIVNPMKSCLKNNCA